MSLETSTPSLDQLVREAKALLGSNPSSEDCHHAIGKVMSKYDIVKVGVYVDVCEELFSQVRAERRTNQPPSPVSRTLRGPMSFAARTAAANEEIEERNYRDFQARNSA